MFNWVLYTSLLPVKYKEQMVLYEKLKKFMAPFYGWGSTVSRLQSHYEETVYFLPLSPQEFLVLI